MFYKRIYYALNSLLRYLLELLFPPKNRCVKDIPIIINNFNRLESLVSLIEAMERRGYHNIYIIDNLSTYPPLLDYYKQCKHKVFLLDKNLGYNALWISGLFKLFKREFFVYTDSDVVPIDECPDDFMDLFFTTLKNNPLCRKVGFSLKIDDIPDHYPFKEKVTKWESQFFLQKRGELLYRAPIDTTFALYRPRGIRKPANNNALMYRTGYPYMARHTPWYIDLKNLSPEDRFYYEHTKAKTTWSNDVQQSMK